MSEAWIHDHAEITRLRADLAVMTTSYAEISRIVGRQGNEEHSLADDVRRIIARLTEAAAFLDTVAGRLDNHFDGVPIGNYAADCRAMAARLRGGGDMITRKAQQEAAKRYNRSPRKMTTVDLCKSLTAIAAFHVADKAAQLKIYEAVRRLEIANREKAVADCRAMAKKLRSET